MNCFACCFSSSEDEDRRPSLIRSSSKWVKSKAQEFPEIKDKCKTLISRMGRHRKNQSADFKYDPLSYALNFEVSEDEESQRWNFAERLPSSPAPEKKRMTSVEFR